MADARLLDTNVLIVASAADDASPFQPEATPVQEKQYRMKVLSWFTAFVDNLDCHAVLDYHWLICTEYSNKLTEQDYGWLALMAKKDRNEIVWVDLRVDHNGHAVLPDLLAVHVTDLADRKMVAGVLVAQEHGHTCKLTNVCDTDWLDCADALKAAGVEVEHLLEHEWLRPKWRDMNRGQ
jgi:hypothetical protein